MSSQNLGEQQGKPDYGILFDDFPNAWEGAYARVIANDWRGLLAECLEYVSIKEVYKARLYGVTKYARLNFSESIGTDDHDNFMAANKRSIFRHLVAFESETIDIESGCKHMAMVALRCLIAIEYDSHNIECPHLEKTLDGDCFDCADAKVISHNITSIQVDPYEPWSPKI
tara:strand:- start:151 stop:663 length:513 start_codon:yes stop_codon:yes gene_type:complete